MGPPKNYVWKPIEPGTVKWHKSYLPEAFADFKKHFTDVDLHRLMERSAREWSIETGVIENAFSLERGVTIQLIKQGFISSLIDRQSNGLATSRFKPILVRHEGSAQCQALRRFANPSSSPTDDKLHPPTTPAIDEERRAHMTFIVGPTPLTGQPRLSKKPGKRPRTVQ